MPPIAVGGPVEDGAQRGEPEVGRYRHGVASEAAVRAQHRPRRIPPWFLDVVARAIDGSLSALLANRHHRPRQFRKAWRRLRELFGNKVGEGQSRLFCCSLSQLCPHGVADTRRSCRERSRHFVFQPYSAQVSLYCAVGIHLRRTGACGDQFRFVAPPHRRTYAATPSRRARRAPDQMCRRAYYCGSIPRNRHRARDNSRQSDRSPRPAHVQYRRQRHRGGPAG